MIERQDRGRARGNEANTPWMPPARMDRPPAHTSRSGSASGSRPTSVGRARQRLVPLLAAAVFSGFTIGANADAPGEWPFAEALEALQEGYVDPVNVGELAMIGLASLSTLDPRITVARSGASVVLRIGDREAGRFPSPGSDDATGWGRLIERCVRTVQTNEELLREVEAAAIGATVLEAVLGRLDSDSSVLAPYSKVTDLLDRAGAAGLAVRVKAGRITVVSVEPGSPAGRAGVLEGDTITRIDDATPETTHRPESTEVRRRETSGPVIVTVERRGLPDAIVFTLERANRTPLDSSASLPGKILHLRWSAFSGEIVDRLGQEAYSRKGVSPEGIILDLRSNSGGLLEHSLEIADHFLRRGRIASSEGRQPGSNEVYTADSAAVWGGVPVVVLINGETASGAELVAAAMQDRKRAIVVGSSSFGRAIVQRVRRLPGDVGIVVTTARLHRSSGASLAERVTPDLCTAGAQGVEDVLTEGALQRRGRVAEAATGGLSRSDCRSDDACPDLDIAVAQRLLADRRLYRRIVRGE